MSETVGERTRKLDPSDPDIPIQNFSSRFKDVQKEQRERRVKIATGVGAAVAGISMIFPSQAKDVATFPADTVVDTAKILGVIKDKVSDELQELARPEVGKVRDDGKQFIEMNGETKEVGEYVYRNISLHSLARESHNSNSEFKPVIIDSLKSNRKVVNYEDLKQIGIDINDPSTRVQGQKVWGDTYNGEIVYPDGSRENVGTVEVNGDYYGKYLKILDEGGNAIAYIPEIFVSYSDNPQDRSIFISIGK